MSRSGYSDDCENWSLICWRGAVTSAIRGARGQAFLREMLAALDAIPEKRLIEDDLIRDGEVCAIGAVGRARGIDMTPIDPEDDRAIAATFGIANAMAREIMLCNDKHDEWRVINQETPERRWERMRKWVISHLAAPAAILPDDGQITYQFNGVMRT